MTAQDTGCDDDRIWRDVPVETLRAAVSPMTALDKAGLVALADRVEALIVDAAEQALDSDYGGERRKWWMEEAANYATTAAALRALAAVQP